MRRITEIYYWRIYIYIYNIMPTIIMVCTSTGLPRLGHCYSCILVSDENTSSTPMREGGLHYSLSHYLMTSYPIFLTDENSQRTESEHKFFLRTGFLVHNATCTWHTW